MSDERLSDEDVAWYAGHTRTYYSTTPNTFTAAKMLAREVQLQRQVVTIEAAVDRYGPIFDLCARHDITVEGIVALVDAMHRGEVGPPKRRVSEQFPTTADAWHDGWLCGWDDNLRHLRRLARGEDA